jgi:hypothetical protein
MRLARFEDAQPDAARQVMPAGDHAVGPHDDGTGGDVVGPGSRKGTEDVFGIAGFHVNTSNF